MTQIRKGPHGKPIEIADTLRRRLIAGIRSGVLARGDRRIYGHRRMTLGDPWMLVVFTVPEAQRALFRLRSGSGQSSQTRRSCSVLARKPA